MMKALVFKSPENIELEEIPQPGLGVACVDQWRATATIRETWKTVVTVWAVSRRPLFPHTLFRLLDVWNAYEDRPAALRS